MTATMPQGAALTVEGIKYHPAGMRNHYMLAGCFKTHAAVSAMSGHAVTVHTICPKTM